MTRVVIVEDHTLVRQSLVKTIAAEPGFQVVGEAGRADDALRVIGESDPDVVMLDIGIAGGNGLDVAAKLREAGVRARILFLTMHEDDASISRAMAIGADGYVVKTASTQELLTALRTVSEDGSYLAPAIARRVMELASGRGVYGGLTARERDILQLLAQGLRPAEVAARLYVSLKTVKNHLTSVYAKLGVSTAAQAVAEAFRRGIVAVPTDGPAASR